MTVGERRTVPGIAGVQLFPNFVSGYTPVAYAVVSGDGTDAAVEATGAGEDTLVDADGTPRVRVVVTAPPSTNRPAFVAVDVGAQHACALTADGAAYCWGAGGDSDWPRDALHAAVSVPRCSYDGRLHSYSVGCTPLPVRVTGAPPLVSLDVGAYRTCGLTAVGASFCWGTGYGAAAPMDVGGPYVALGVGVMNADCGVRADGSLVCVDAQGVSRRLRADILFDTLASSSSSAPSRACALDREGVAYCWGYGPLGDGVDRGTSSALDPVRVTGDVPFVTLAVGVGKTCALTADGRPYCWGIGVPDATGQIPPNGVLVPTAVPTDLRFRSIATTLSTCGLTADGAAYCWDAGAFAPKFGSLRFRSLSLGLGLRASCGILTGGDAVCWGSNEYGLTGVGALSGTTEEPTRVAGQLSAP
ncbi:MAG: RCC1 domain-containing protein [Gemmatimonadaceae bacterium]